MRSLTLIAGVVRGGRETKLVVLVIINLQFIIDIKKCTDEYWINTNSEKDLEHCVF